MSNSIPVYGTCDPRFSKVQALFQHSFDSGQEIGASVSFVLDGESVVDLWGGHYDEKRMSFGGLSMRFGLGFMLSENSNRYARLSPNPRAFGHTSAGGSLGMTNPDAKIGFGFTTNLLQPGLVTAGSTPTAMIDASYTAL